MAGPGTAKQQQGFADVFGGRQFNTVDYTGVASYVNGTGELLDPMIFGFKNLIQAVVGTSISQDGVYWVIAQPTGNGQTTWHLRWMLVAGGEVTNGTDLHLKTVKLSAIGY